MKLEDFWTFVDASTADECWPWKRSRCSDGYGTARVDGRTVGTHRVAWTLTNGEIPSGLSVLHRCDNPPCCNPNHLFLGTQAENCADRQRKGRTNRDPRNQGSTNGYARLTEDMVRWARQEVAAGRPRGAVAQALGVHRATVGFAVTRKTWRHVQ